jgi:hypothetical protein
MATGYSGKKSHDDAVTAAEGVRQAAVAGASMSAVRTAELAFARTCYKSSIANNAGADLAVWSTMLTELGVRGP